MKITRTLKTASMLFFILLVMALMGQAIFNAYNLTPKSTASVLRTYPLWQIPFRYIWDYIQHAWLCLTFAFIVSGLFHEFIPQDLMIRHMSSGKSTSYLVATLAAPLLCVCSCTMVPIFAGLVYTGSGIGPALTFLLVAPANNLLSDIITIQMLGWQIALADMVAAGVSAIAIGYLVSKTPWGKLFEKQVKNNDRTVVSLQLEEQTLDERLWSSLEFGEYIAKQTLPALLVGLVLVSYFHAFFPEKIIATWLTGPFGVVVAAFLGGPLYTPTLIEIVLGKALVDLGMSPAATLAWLMGQPYDIPNSLSASRVVGWKIVITYGLLAFISAVLSGLIYGALTNTI